MLIPKLDLTPAYIDFGWFYLFKVRLSSHLKYHNADELATGRLVAQAGTAAAGLGHLDETSAVNELLPTSSGGLGESIGDVANELSAWVCALSPEQLGLIFASSILSGAGAGVWVSAGFRLAFGRFWF